VEDRRTSKFMKEQRLAMARMKQLSQERDQKIMQTMESAAQIEREKREQVIRKMQENEARVQKQRQLMIEHLEFRKHINLLKQLKKDWNMRRKQRKEEYLKALSEDKLKTDEAKVNQFKKERKTMIRSRSAINRALELQQFQIKEALHSMALTKKWSPAVIEQLAGGSLDLASGKVSTRGSLRPRTAAG